MKRFLMINYLVNLLLLIGGLLFLGGITTGVLLFIEKLIVKIAGG